jgi:hypothetical protein
MKNHNEELHQGIDEAIALLLEMKKKYQELKNYSPSTKQNGDKYQALKTGSWDSGAPSEKEQKRNPSFPLPWPDENKDGGIQTARPQSFRLKIEVMLSAENTSIQISDRCSYTPLQS